MKKQNYPNTNRNEDKFTDEDFFDDCIICQGMKKAQKKGRPMGEEELKDLFAKQNRKNKVN
ncbi:hypothetical protein ACFL1A_03380 [Patescibacteria group bacterium]